MNTVLLALGVLALYLLLILLAWSLVRAGARADALAEQQWGEAQRWERFVEAMRRESL